jgi:integrase
MGEMRPPAKVQSRERVLDDHEVQVFWLACERLGDPWGTLFRLLLLTGQRREEVASVSWSDIAHDVWTIPAHRAKNGRTHLVPLPSEARKLLASYRERQGVRSGLVFTTTGTTPLSGFSKAKRRLDGLMSDLEQRRTGEQAYQLTPWRTHDLRRTAATGFQKLGVRLEVTEAILNHVSGSRAGIVGVYQRYNWATEKAEALQRWSDHLVSLCGGNMEPCNPMQKHLRVVA